MPQPYAFHAALLGLALTAAAEPAMTDSVKNA